ncbi:unnamed protein product [Phytomonas sp. EM1]|nr:unnamed protein product [Phytomonas sp. EM1]|eukprot:CCW59866.1 unnamed protein product [Phytomonas sp. isolate EM1]
MAHDSADTPTSTVDNQDERQALARLTEELKQTQSKFEEWKAKAKVGVDQLRGRIVELTTQLEASESQRQTLVMSLDKLRSSKEGDLTWIEGLGMNHNLGLLALERERAVGEYLLQASHDKIEAVWEALLLQFNDFPPNAVKDQPSSTSEDELERYKQRVATTMKLQQKNSEALQNQVVELQQRLQLAEKELQERAAALSGKEETVSLLEQRLSSVERAYEELQQTHDTPLGGPNMDRISAMEERMEEELDRLRAEFMQHENTVLMQHHDELERLQSMHEREIQAIQQEAEERLARELDAALSFQKPQAMPSPSSPSTQEDAAYLELLKEFEALESQHRTLIQEHAAMKNIMQQLNSRKDAEGTDDRKAISISCHQHNPTSLAEAKELIEGLQTCLTTTTDQLWQLKKSLMSGNENKAPEGALDPQHVTYLRSIIVNIFCLCDKNSTIAKLLPVTSTLLEFSKEDLDAIYANKPEWKRRQ